MDAKEILEGNKHISDDEVLCDIHDTQKEITKFKEEIVQREAFIKKLNYLMDIRHPPGSD